MTDRKCPLALSLPRLRMTACGVSIRPGSWGLRYRRGMGLTMGERKSPAKTTATRYERAHKAGKAMCIGRYIERAMSLQQKQFRSIYWRSARIPTVRYSFSEYTTGCLMAHCLPRSPVPMPRIAPPRLRW